MMDAFSNVIWWMWFFSHFGKHIFHVFKEKLSPVERSLYFTYSHSLLGKIHGKIFVFVFEVEFVSNDKTQNHPIKIEKKSARMESVIIIIIVGKSEIK